MASEDNVRCVKYLYLLGNGGLEAERGVVIRETSNQSQSLENLLSENRFRFRHLPELVLGQIFTTNGEINADIGSWNMEVLFHVIKVLFWKVLSPRERSAINTLHSYREDVDRSDTSVMANDYKTLRADVRTAIDDIAQGLCETRRLRLREVVNISATYDLDIQDTANQVRQLNEFPDELLESLENRFGDVVYPSRVNRSNTPFNFGERGATSRNFGGPNECQNDESSNSTILKTPYTGIRVPDPQDSQDDEQSDVTHLERRHQLRRREQDPQDSQDDEESDATHLDRRHQLRRREQDPQDSQDDEESDATHLDRRHQLRRREQGNDAVLTVRSTSEDQRIITLLGKIEQLVRIQTSENESREPFWESINAKVVVECDTASNADAAQTKLIRTVNRIISRVNLPEIIRNAEIPTHLPEIIRNAEIQTHSPAIIRNSEIPTPELPSPAMQRGWHVPEFSEMASHSIQAVQHAVDMRGDQNDNTFPHASDLSSLMEGNVAVSQGNSMTRWLLPIIDVHIIEGSLNLLDPVLSLLIDIYKLGSEDEVHVLSAGQGCVEFMIRCRSYMGVSNLLNFLKSDRFLDRLRAISVALEQQLENPVTLSPYIPEGSLRNLEIFIAGEFDRMPKKRSLALRINYGSIMNLGRIQQYLKSDKAKEHYKNISHALSELHARSTDVKASLKPEEMRRALENRSDRLLYSTGNTSTVLHTCIQNEDKKSKDLDLKGISKYKKLV